MSAPMSMQSSINVEKQEKIDQRLKVSRECWPPLAIAAFHMRKMCFSHFTLVFTMHVTILRDVIQCNVSLVH